MWILPILGYIGLLLGFAFLTLAIASGLYYLSELVEEHTVFAKKFLRQLIFGVIAFQVLLSLIDGLPWFTTAISIVSQVVYFQNLRHFPTVRLSDPIFILSCILVLLNHYLWFKHFSAPPPRSHASSYYGTDFHSSLPSFTEIASFFFLQVWLVPFALFVSLSASENVLPSMGSEYATDHSGAGASSSARGYGGGAGYLSSRGGGGTGASDGTGMGMASDASKKKASKGMARAAVDGVLDWASETGELMGFWKGERTRQW